jgi:hypothetical protein
MKKLFGTSILAALTLAAVTWSGAAAAAHVSVGIYAGGPAYYAPPPPVVYVPRPYYAPPPAVYVAPGWERTDWRARREWREREWRRQRWEHHHYRDYH